MLSKLTRASPSACAASATATATETIGYDSNGYVNAFTDWNGNQTTYTNNGHGQPTTINEAVGSSVARTHVCRLCQVRPSVTPRG